MNVSTLLKNVNSGSSVEDILAGLSRLQTIAGIDPEERAAAEVGTIPDSSAEQFQATIDDIRNQLYALSDRYDLLLNKVSRFEVQEDARLWSDLDGVLERTIINYQTAYEATLKYNEDWFADALISDGAKVELAAKLLYAVRKFCPSNLKTLELVSQRDSGMMAQIQAPKLIRT